MNLRRPIALIAVITLALWFTGCSGGSGSPPDPPAISVVLNPQPPSSMDAGKTTSLAAAVSNDTSNAGVKWSVSCGSSQCGSFSPASTASGATAVTFNPAPPASLSSSASASLIAVVSNHNANAGQVDRSLRKRAMRQLQSGIDSQRHGHQLHCACRDPHTCHRDGDRCFGNRHHQIGFSKHHDHSSASGAGRRQLCLPPGRGRRHRVILCYRRVYRPERRH